jgi:hypothetical protein
VRQATPERVADAIADKENELSAYYSKCEDCWLLIHSEPVLSPNPNFGAEFELDVEALENTCLDTDFEGVW